MKLFVVFTLLFILGVGSISLSSDSARAKFDEIVKDTGLDYTDRKTAWLAGAIQEHADRKNEPLTLTIGQTTPIMANYKFTPDTEDMQGLQKALKLSPGHCRSLDGTKICATKTQLKFTPVTFPPDAGTYGYY